MKTAKGFGFALALGLAMFLSANLAAQTNVNVPDPNLENAVRSAVGKTNGPLTTADLLRCTNLTAWAVVTNLSGLEYAAYLETLRLYYGNPGSLSPLGALAHLRSLSIEYGGGQDLTGLPGLTGLTNLDLYASSFTNASCLAGLTNLLSLDLSWTFVSDPSPLAGLHLRYLDLSACPLGNGGALAGLTNLAGSLYLDSVPLTNIDCLAGLSNLDLLSLYQDPVHDLAPLSNLTSLASLDLGYVPVRNLPALAGLTNLEALYLEGTGISNLNRLPVLPRLAVLDANYNRLGDLDALAGFTNLQWLNATFNCLTNIDALTNLDQLQTAYLQVNLLNTNSGSASMNVIQALLSEGVHVEYYRQNGPPGISLPGQWVIPAAEPSSRSLSIWDDLTLGERLVVGARSSNTGLVTAAIRPGPIAEQTVTTYLGVPNGLRIPGWSGYLDLSPVPGQAGTTTIIVSATDDTGLTSEAILTVTVSQPAAFDGQAVGNSNSNLSWRTFGGSPWQGQTNVVHAGGSVAAQSGSGESWLEATLTGPGMLTFWWRFDATNWGSSAELTARCAESGLTAHAWLTQPFSSPAPSFPGSSAAIDWQPGTLSFPPGRWIVRWHFAPGRGEDSGVIWVADANFTPGPPAAWLESSWRQFYPGYFNFYLHGPPGGTYDVEVSPDLRQWSRSKRLTLADFQAYYVDWTATNAAGFYRLRQSTLAPIWFEPPSLSLDGDRTVRLRVHSEPEQPLSIEWSTNLLSWETLVQTNNPAGTLEIAAGPATDSSARFYRAKALPWPPALAGSPGQARGTNARRHSWPPIPPPQIATPGH